MSDEDTFGALLESELPDSVVYNLAMPGFGVDQVWMTVRHYALPVKPDLVIVVLVDADFKRSLTAYRIQEGRNKPAFRLDGGKLVRKTAEDRPNPLVRYLDNHSRLWMSLQLAARGVGYFVPFGEWWHLNRAFLDVIQADCAEAGVPVLFVYLPTKA